MIISRRSICL